ncbi:recombinase family protein [Nitrospina watsonii]|uniref:recombinase family protein n=1 Tax=Nitrospina watsonii TaxID=1323948 RepID=UPI002493C2B1|nr:recombinase family protein [Nitrospina watsonii]
MGYLRVSTEEQRPDRQLDGLKGLCDEVHLEKLSATSKKRPVYQKILKKLKAGDTLVVWDLDRAFRSTVDALLESEKLRQRGIEFQIVTLNVDTSTPSGELIYTVMAAFAQFERQNLIKRTREGMAAARRRGKHIGRPYKLDSRDVAHAHAKIHAGKSTIMGMARELGCSRSTLSHAFQRFGLSL